MQPFIDFILELDKLKTVTRRTRPLGLDRFENPAEHSWQIAMMAASFAPLAAEPVNVDRVIRMLLVHDIGEIDTGDRLVYAEGGWDEHRAAERTALERIFGLLPDGHARPFLDLWHEFEAAATPEARFAHAVDRAMPALLNLVNHGQSWRENGITYDQVIAKLEGPIRSGCPALWDYMAVRLDDARRAGWFGTTV
jgi:putative hydrolase of HD superfamily